LKPFAVVQRRGKESSLTHYVGLDVSMEETSVCVIDFAGATLWEGKVPSDPASIERSIRKWAPKAERIGLETGPTSTWLWHEFNAAGLPVAGTTRIRIKPNVSVATSCSRAGRRGPPNRRADRSAGPDA
jgi:hypothetical protein